VGGLVSFPYARWVAVLERHQRGIVVGSVLVALLSLVSLTRLRLDINVLGMLPQGRPAFDDFKAFVADFGELDELIILLHGATPGRLQDFTDRFAERLRALETVVSVQARVDPQAILDGLLGRWVYNYLTDKDYDELEARLTPAAIEVQVAANRAILSAPFDLSTAQAVMTDPLGVRRLAAAGLADSYGRAGAGLRDGYFSAPDGSALLIVVRPRESAFDVAFSERLMRDVRRAEAETRESISRAGEDGPHAATAQVRVDYTGSYVYALEDAGTLRWDIARYTTLALVGVLAVFYVGYRNLRILPFVTYPLVLTTLMTFALGLLLFDELNAVSISFAAILYGLSIDSAIYFYTRVLQERHDRDLRGAVTATLAGLGRANLAASTTTAAAFLVIGFSCLSAVRQLGILTALGMLLTTVEFFTLYPALSFFLLRGRVGAASAFETPRLARLADASARRARLLAAGAVLLGVLLLVGARRVGLDVQLTHLRPHDSQAARVQDDISARFGQQGGDAAVLVGRVDLEQALEDSEAVAARLAGYRESGVLQSVQSVRALLPSQRVQRARLERYNRLPRDAAAEALAAALQRQGFVAERFAQFLADFRRPREELIQLDTPALAPLAPLLQHHVRARNGEYIVATYFHVAPGASLEAIAQRLRGDGENPPLRVAARALLEEELGMVLHRELAGFWALGLAGNFALLFATFWSVATAVVILAPVVLVVIALFAGMWAMGIALDPVNLIVTPLIFGIGVDYGVYIVARAQEQGGGAAALRYTGRAVAVTALTTIAGFGFLGLSRFPALATMGLLAGVGLFLCLLLSISLLPALLTLVRKRER
jgi:uncharacterized protein